MYSAGPGPISNVLGPDHVHFSLSPGDTGAVGPGTLL